MNSIKKISVTKFKKITLKTKIDSKGCGGVEIDLTSLGFKDRKMSAYCNYLGGGMVGKIAHNSNCFNPTKEEKEILDNIGVQLAQYYYRVSNRLDSKTNITKEFEFNQKLSVSAY